MRFLNVILIVMLCGMFAALTAQYRTTNRLASELEALRIDLALPQQPVRAESSAPKVIRERATGDASLGQRLASLEESVAQLVTASEYLMDRGQLPPTESKVAAMMARLGDASASDSDRLQALRTLRRNNALTDEGVMYALSLLQGSTNSGLRADVLRQFEGMTNSLLRDPMMLAATDANADVREQAVEVLRGFSNDPQVEALLWKALQDGEGDVRREAREALLRGPMSDERIASLSDRVVEPTASMEERVLAWQVLSRAPQRPPEASAALVDLAHSTTDPTQRSRLFRAFDDANDPAFVPSLVEGLQDPHPGVRERAADALGDFRSDANVIAWLTHVAQNDPDPTVRREAERQLTRDQGGGGGGRNQGERRR